MEGAGEWEGVSRFAQISGQTSNGHISKTVRDHHINMVRKFLRSSSAID